jgi:hypothetical protein
MSKFVQDNPIKENITDPEGLSSRDPAPAYDDNRDQFKKAYQNPMGNNFMNPYNQVQIPEIEDEEKEKLSENPEALLQYSVANFKRRLNKYNTKF